MIVNSKGELPVAVPHVSDEEDNWKPFSGSALRDEKAICFSINVTSTHFNIQYNVLHRNIDIIFICYFFSVMKSKILTYP